ncbi:asparaginase [Paracoccus fistulariae]|uniref:Asparaginase n=1 Tax=Paracoccus fistulariae TaxID=658446 RepID=A0ABY7SH02_9RHOB|nr:asparaginase [Paracoccus fistulariae]MDB6182827.1 asparaginase [Paracoccus fistulariae]WCR06159.1 asparaginase [Paracoccus fistulariae]
MRSAELIELWRGGQLESLHRGHVVICDKHGVVEAWGKPSQIIFPRSSCKMIQALPLIESGAADDAGLTDRQLALACASHNGARLHVDAVEAWLKDLGLSESDLRCGNQMPEDKDEKRHLICSETSPCQYHNNCSGKHAGFLTLNRHLKGGSEYDEVDHPVQQAIKDAFEEVTGETSPGYGIDGCSAPNWSCSLEGLGRAMAAFANPGSDRRGQAMRRLTDAMRTYPEMVAGEGRACTTLMRAMNHSAVVKTGAEAVFVGILPEQGLGIALKIRDGATRASEAAITALLVHLGLLDEKDPAVGKYLTDPMKNWRGKVVGEMRTSQGFPA